MGQTPFARATAVGAALILLLLVATPAAAANPLLPVHLPSPLPNPQSPVPIPYPTVSIAEPWTMVDSELGPVWEAVGPICAQVLEDLREEGHVGNRSGSHKAYGFEGEWLRYSPECAELRDELQWTVWGDDTPYVEECRPIQGMTYCIAIGHYACDFALFATNGVLDWCWGGIFPNN